MSKLAILYDTPYHIIFNFSLFITSLRFYVEGLLRARLEVLRFRNTLFSLV